MLEYALKALAVLVMVWGVLNAALLLAFTRAGIVLLLLVAFATVIAALAGSTLLAADFLVPGALTFAGVPDLLLLLAAAATLATLFMVGLKRPVVRVLRRLGAGRTWADVGFAYIHGLVTVSLLAAVARFIPGMELAMGDALAAGFIGAFGFYFVELVFVYSGPVDSEEMALVDPSSEKRGDDW